MIQATPESDVALRRRLKRVTACHKDYWSFKGNSRREHGHGFFQYPAMMVPQMVRAVLQKACAVHPEIKWVGDPFVGSGTLLTESMLRGLNFSGRDINPLAVLLCRAKSGPFYPDTLARKIKTLNALIENDKGRRIEVSFPNRNKWFRRDVLISLSRIRRSIVTESSVWARRFFWIALAETVRYSSNSRTSTFKLHTRSQDDIADRKIDPVTIFTRTLSRNLEHLRTQAEFLKSKKLLKRGRYTLRTSIVLGDARLNKLRAPRKCDIIITSPPYGDNSSTVPYGQYSYLPLQWVDMSDIDANNSINFLMSTHAIDFRSLGGSCRIAKDIRSNLCARSSAFKRLISKLKNKGKDCVQRITSFFRDLDLCLPPILQSLRNGGLMVWVLGNRRVGGVRVPLDTILSQLLFKHKVFVLISLRRRISSKRMALKNNTAKLMSSETILVMRKAIAHG